MNDINIGLEGVVVGRTAISRVDGSRGRLGYRGHDITELMGRPFVQVAWLLLFGDLPSPRQEQQLAHFLLAHRHLNEHEQALLAALPLAIHPMLVLQSMVPVLDLSLKADLTPPVGGDDALHGLIIAARLPSLVAAWFNRQADKPWPLRCNSLDPNRAFLKSLSGREPNTLAVDVFSKTQILQMEHSYNAGTFAGRVALSTRAPIQSSIAASIGTLSGSLHGGADQAALEFAAAVGEPTAAENAVQKVLLEGGRIMGMGHREYSTVDPRATLLKPLARSLCAGDTDSQRLLQTLEAVEAASIKALQGRQKNLRANVEFYKGAVFHALGLPSHYFTAVFAMARVYGYVAHAIEFRPQARLIRPRAEYCAVEDSLGDDRARLGKL
ncbi:MAG: citrate/2-methylcitrate synthase [Halieaceae bacterium]